MTQTKSQSLTQPDKDWVSGIHDSGLLAPELGRFKRKRRLAAPRSVSAINFGGVKAAKLISARAHGATSDQTGEGRGAIWWVIYRDWTVIVLE